MCHTTNVKIKNPPNKSFSLLLCLLKLEHFLNPEQGSCHGFSSSTQTHNTDLQVAQAKLVLSSNHNGREFTEQIQNIDHTFRDLFIHGTVFTRITLLFHSSSNKSPARWRQMQS